MTTNQDGTQKYASYSVCGCAGNETATLTDERGRQQKVYSDVLGRQWKTEVLNWNGTVHSTTTNTLSVLDQVKSVRQTDNATGVYQDTTMEYDGYGRLHTKHVPEQNVGKNTVYEYNADDTISSVMDARDASATYVYNNRHLVKEIHYSAPSAPDVTCGYDPAGNSISMTDGMGSKSCAYNQLSEILSETRTLNGVGTFTLGYTYNLAGELTSLTDPYGAQINYQHDAIGRLTTVTGSSFGGVTQYASNAQYRAAGGLKAYGLWQRLCHDSEF